MARRKASIRDVARLAGVAPSTVSRSLTGSSYVSADTRERIRRAIAELGYLPPERTGGRTRTVAVLARFPSAWFFAEAIAGIEQVLRSGGCELVLHNIGDPEGRRHVVESLPMRDGPGRPDGLIVVSSSFTERELGSLRRLDVPVVVVGGTFPGAPRVGIDDRAAAATAVRHLVGLGHRDIGLVSFDPDDTVGQETTRARHAGFADALAEAGLSERPEWVVATGYDGAAGARAVERLLSLPALPTALLVMSDEMALGVLRTLRRAGVDVPGRISVVGFDDQPVAEFAELTTIAQPAREQGERAAELLLAALGGGAAGAGAAGPAPSLDLPTRLVIRSSTAPARTQRRGG